MRRTEPMAKCIVTTYVDHPYVERLDAEAARRGVTRAAMAREVLQAAFPPLAPERGDEAVEAEDDE
jgi:hypothetical protein